MSDAAASCASEVQPPACRSRWLANAALRPGLALRALALGALVLLAYLPALEAGFVFDDAMYLTGDERMAQGLAGLKRIWTEVGGESYRHQYYPLTGTALWAQYELWGPAPAGYHLVNVLGHAVNAILLWRLLVLVGTPGAGAGAWLAGAIFGLHPVHVPSVAWVSEIKNVLSTLFFLLALLAWVQWLGPAGVRGGARTAALGLALFVLALLAKTATCVLPVALGAIAYWKRGRLGGRELRAVGLLAAVGLAAVLTTVFLESAHRAGGEEFALPWWRRVQVAGASVWFYAGTLAWPSGLSFVYPRWHVDAWTGWAWIAPGAAAGALAALWALRGRIGRGPLCAAAYFVAAAAPVSLVRVAYARLSYVADHWVYLASLGLIALLAGAACWWVREAAAGPGSGAARPGGARRRAGAMLAACAVLAVLGTLTWRRAELFRSERSLWLDTVERNPSSPIACYNLGVALWGEGDREGAIACYRQAVEIDPCYAAALNNLGAALRARGGIEEAIACYEAALLADPSLAGARHNLGDALLAAGREAEAAASFDEAARLRPGFAAARHGAGVALRRLGDFDAALGRYRGALALDPGSPAFLSNAGEVLLEMGRLDEAERHLREALGADPGAAPAHYNLAILHEGRGELEAAIAHYAAAVRGAPGSAEVRRRLARALCESGRPHEALAHFREAAALDPRDAGAVAELALCLVRVASTGQLR